jgi:uncharacterized spore protein YtfJ
MAKRTEGDPGAGGRGRKRPPAVVATPESERPAGVQRFVEAIGERLHGSASVRQVFGDPIRAEGRTIVPVARVAYGFGAGGGKTEDSADRRQQGEGGGGGGGVSATPVGVIEIGATGTRFVPIATPARTIGLLLTGAGLGLLLGARLRRRPKPYPVPAL